MIHILANDFYISNKMTYTCLYCSWTFATPYTLKCHISEKHQYIDEDEPSHSTIKYDEPDLWSDNLLIDEVNFWNEDLPTKMIRSWYCNFRIENN